MQAYLPMDIMVNIVDPQSMGSQLQYKNTVNPNSLLRHAL